MKRSLIALIAVLTFSGCSSTPVMEKGAQDAFMRNFASTNLTIANRYYRNFQQYEGLTRAYWETILENLSTDSALAFKRDMGAFDVIRVKGFEKGVIVCAYSNYYETGFCDNTRCEGTELSGIKTEDQLGEAMSKVLAYTCSK